MARFCHAGTTDWRAICSGGIFYPATFYTIALWRERAAVPTYLVPITLALLLSLPFFWRLEQDLQAHTAAYLAASLSDTSLWEDRSD